MIRKHLDRASCGEALHPGVFHMLRGKLRFNLFCWSQSSRTSKNKNKQQDFKKMCCFPSRRLYQLKTCVVCRSPGLIKLLERKMTSEQTSQVSTFQNFGCSIGLIPGQLHSNLHLHGGEQTVSVSQAKSLMSLHGAGRVPVQLMFICHMQV